MDTFKFGPSIPGTGQEGCADGQSFLEVAGVEGSTLRATRAGLVIRHGHPALQSSAADRHWPYYQLESVRLDAYGPVGVVRATIRATGSSLPLLLLEPEQIEPARRTLEIVWNLMASANNAERASS